MCIMCNIYMCVRVCVCLCVCSVAQKYPTLCNPIDCSLPGSAVHGISETKILGWVAISLSRQSFWPRDRTYISYIGRQIFFTTEHPGKPTLFSEGETQVQRRLRNYLRSKLVVGKHRVSKPRDWCGQSCGMRHWQRLQKWISEDLCMLSWSKSCKCWMWQREWEVRIFSLK